MIFYIINLVILDINIINKYIKGYCEYEETVLLDLEGSNNEIIDINYKNEKLYLLFKGQYAVIGQTETQYFEICSDYYKIMTVKVNEEENMIFLGKNKIYCNGVEYLFEDQEIISNRDDVCNPIIQQMLVLDKKLNQYLQIEFNFETKETDILIDLQQISNIKMKQLFKVEKKNTHIIQDEKKKLFLVCKINFFNYIQNQLEIKIDFIKIANEEMEYLKQKQSNKKNKKKIQTNVSLNKENNINYSNANNIKLTKKDENKNLDKQDENSSQDAIQDEEQQLLSDTQTFLKCIREYDSKNNDQDENDIREQEQEINYNSISNMFYRLQREKSNQEDGLHKGRLQYNKTIYQGKTVNKSNEICLICKKIIINTENIYKKQAENKLFFVFCRHSFHKQCVLTSNKSHFLRQNQCPICAEYDNLQELPPQSF